MKSNELFELEWRRAFEQLPEPKGLVRIPEADFVLDISQDRAVYEQLGMIENDFSLRVTERTLDALYCAKDVLPRNEQLVITSAYRSSDFLLALWLRRMKTLEIQFPDWSVDDRIAFGSRYTASPYHPGSPPHARGDAVDVALRRDGHPVQLDTFAEHPDQFYAQMTFDFFAGRDNAIHTDRLHLRDVMTSAGFLPYNAEFWHFGLTPVWPEVSHE